ncbi:hypothetical protein LOAG_01870 [Loa loa]|uniref:Uncharacterized protein n=1 Tax=Loa loa TaxID=7209 RepID=A0A1S0U7R9_LOALO|nr:hypothetical protein LOAG_01870 [Loa loa]EFO26614.1 hypothetical protein LOAG_01870 [Loa loa]
MRSRPTYIQISLGVKEGRKKKRKGESEDNRWKNERNKLICHLIQRLKIGQCCDQQFPTNNAKSVPGVIVTRKWMTVMECEEDSDVEQSWEGGRENRGDIFFAPFPDLT